MSFQGLSTHRCVPQDGRGSLRTRYGWALATFQTTVMEPTYSAWSYAFSPDHFWLFSSLGITCDENWSREGCEQRDWRSKNEDRTSLRMTPADYENEAGRGQRFACLRSSFCFSSWYLPSVAFDSGSFRTRSMYMKRHEWVVNNAGYRLGSYIGTCRCL